MKSCGQGIAVATRVEDDNGVTLTSQGESGTQTGRSSSNDEDIGTLRGGHGEVCGFLDELTRSWKAVQKKDLLLLSK
jgi:hypothetical protein